MEGIERACSAFVDIDAVVVPVANHGSRHAGVGGSAVVPFVVAPAVVAVDDERSGLSVIDFDGGVVAIALAVVADCAAALYGVAVTLGGDGEGLLTLHAMLVGVGGAVDVALVGGYCDLTRCGACVPLPVAGVGSAFGQL